MIIIYKVLSEEDPIPISDLEEMEDSCERVLKKIMMNQKKTIHLMNEEKVSELKEMEKRKHELILDKINLGIQIMQSALYDL